MAEHWSVQQVAPWLVPDDTPQAALARGTAAGAAIGANYTRGLAAGNEANFQQLQAAIATEDAKQRAQLAALSIDQKMNQREGVIQFGDAANRIGELPDAWANPAVPSILGEVAKKYPWMPLSDAIKWHEVAKDAKARQDEIAQFHREQYDAKLQAVDAARAKAESDSAFKSASLGLKDQQLNISQQRLALAQEGTPSPGLKAANEIMTLQSQLDDANAKGDSTTAGQLTQKLQLLKDAFPAKANEEIEMSQDANGRPVFRITRGGKGTNTATENFAQKNLIGFKAAVEQMGELQRNLRPEDLGVRGVLGEFLGDKVIPQFDPTASTFDAKRVKNRTDLRAGLESLVGQLTNDKRTSNTDRARLEALGPSAGIFENEPRAKQAILTVTDVMKNRAQANALEAGMPIEQWMMTDKDIADSVREGKITKEKGAELRRKFYPYLYK